MAQNKTKKEAGGAVWYALAVSRILLGWIFLWAFLDKVFGWGYATTSARAWINGGSPTKGFLSHATGPFGDFFQSLAGHAWVDWLFMVGLLGIGVALIAGVCVRLAAVTGSILLLGMWAASLPLDNNPFVDDHLVYIAMLWVIALGQSQQRWSLSKLWQKLPVVGSVRWLR